MRERPRDEASISRWTQYADSFVSMNKQDGEWVAEDIHKTSRQE